MEALADHEILVGTYEEFVLGFYPSNDGTPTLTPSFTDQAHCGPVLSATAGKFLLSGGSNDESAKIFNLRNRSEHGQLYHHDGAINAVTFYDDKNVITGAEDNKICIVRAGTWAVEKTLLKHQAGVNDVSIHPSGKLALSVAKDRKLITWNLVKGRSAYVTNLHEIADVVQWSPKGTRYAVGLHRRVDVYDVATAAVACSLQVKGRANAIAWVDEDIMAVAADMPEIVLFSAKEKKEVGRFAAHEKRVRCLRLLREGGALFLVSASNDGMIKVWKSEEPSEEEDGGGFDLDFEEVASHDTKCRITCMAVHKVPEVKAEPLSKKELKRRAQEALKEAKGADDEGDKPKKKRVTMMMPPEPVKVESEGEEEEATSKKPKLVVELEDESSEKAKKGKKRKRKSST